MTAFTRFVLGLAILCVAPPSSDGDQAPSGPTTVRIDAGPLSGVLVGERQDVVAFRGVPYAKQPVGELRWRPPRPLEPWTGVRAADEFGAGCLQSTPRMSPPPERMDEGCLYLNVWTPADHGGERLPVMVWIHGGGFNQGAGSLYDGEALARRGVVVVTVNYRLGIFGYFAHPLLSQESKHGVSGNYGLLDILAALEWVQRNAAAFGGDPERVTIFGESAGAIAVITLMVSPQAQGLFHRAISESYADLPFAHLKERWFGYQPMEEMGERIAEQLGCSDEPDPLAALRAIDAEELFAGARATPDLLFATAGFRYWPAIDGWLVPDDPMALFAAGKQHDVPLLIGSNADEQAARPPTRITDATAYEAWVRRVSRSESHATRVLEAFPASSPDAMAHGVERIMTLSLLVTPPRIFARAMEKVPSRCYLYHFTRVPPGARGVGAYHALEIPYVFNNLATSRIARLPGKTGEYFEAKDLELSAAISSYWVQFAATGDPNRESSPTWPAYETETDHHLELGDEIKVGQGLHRELIDLFTEILTELRAARKDG